MTALESALAAIAAFPATDDASAVIAAKARGLMIGYAHRWQASEWETISVEEVYHLPVLNPETGAKSRTFTQAGKVDGIVSYSGRTYLLEHKTTSEDIEPNSTYWRRLAIDSQVSAYVLANWQQGRKLDGTLYDVIRKPGIRPKNLSKAEAARIVATGAYCGFKIPMRLREAVAAGQSVECPELYATRLSADCIENPDKYFGRRVIPRLDSEITEYASELWEVGQSIISARARNAHYRNSASCVQYSTPCEYLGICSGHDSPESDKWRRADNVHSELPVIGDDAGREVLTNSRIKCFQACRRKHQFRYEIGLRRRDEEEREALVFGSIMHAALESYWLCFRKEEGNGNHANAAGGTESPAGTAAETQLAG